MGLESYPPVDLIVLNRLMQVRQVTLRRMYRAASREMPFMRCFSTVSEAGSKSFRIRIEYVYVLNATISIIEAPLVSHLNLPSFNLFVGSWNLWPTG